VYDGSFDTFLSELCKPFQLKGLAALVLLLVLSVTSLHALVRRMGARRWKALHRLTYVAAALAAWHQIEARKVFPPQVWLIFGPVVVLQAARWWRERRPRAPAV
jgi:sulfoxide reductase heme-binding subunit YedZ